MEAARHRELAPAPRWLRPLLAVVLVAIVLLLLVFRRPLAERLWPDTRAEKLEEKAARALAEGRLSASDGSGARELYEAALAIDPDRSDARIGLNAVGQVALAQARVAIASGRYAEAQRDLQVAEAVAVPRAQVDELATQLRTREAARTGIEQLLAQAQAASAAHRLDGGPDAALPLYRRVLALQPDRIEALEGREDALADLLQQARQALQRGELAYAAAMVAAARGYDAGHADLPQTQAQLATALDRARQQADTDLRHERLDRATERYRALLAIDPEDAAAQHGLERVATAWAHRAERLAADFRFADAAAALHEARALAPGSEDVDAAERHVARARQAQARLGSKLSPGTRAQRVRTLLAEAAAAEGRGDLLTPPGDSAFDKLAAARALAPDDPAVRRAGARLLPAARECFERELRSNNLGRARACLDAWSALEGATAVIGGKRRLAQRWLAVGDEHLGAGDLQAAQTALVSARAIDPLAPGLAEFAERLRLASAAR